MGLIFPVLQVSSLLTQFHVRVQLGVSLPVELRQLGDEVAVGMRHVRFDALNESLGMVEHGVHEVVPFRQLLVVPPRCGWER